MTDKKIAIVYDWIDKWGGVERVLLTLHEMFPEAPFYTSYYNSKNATWAKDLDIRPSFIQSLPSFIKNNRIPSLFLYPYAFESFNLSEYDVVISVTSSFAKAVITRPETRHICYLLTPTRFLWSHTGEYRKTGKVGLLGGLGEKYKTSLRTWDYVAAQRPDKMISISNVVAERCQKYYGRESKVIYPGFDIDYWEKIKLETRNQKFETNSKFKALNGKKYYLVVARLEKYKKVELVVDVFNKLEDKQLVVVGTGTEEKKLRKIVGNNITLLNKVSDSELASLYTHAEAFIMPQEEDFGFVALEAQFFGCPVIAYAQGGAQETIISGKTGIFFTKQTLSSLEAALARFETISYNLRTKSKEFGPKNVERFTKARFIEVFQRSCNL